MPKILCILLLCFASWAQAADLAWNASVVDEEHAAPDGYRIHWGSEPGVYTGQADAGLALTWHIPDDWYGQYYFVASAYNSAGQSGYSNEVIFTRDQPQQYIGSTGLTVSRYQVEGQQMASDNFTGENDTALPTHDANWSFVTGGDNGRIYNNGLSYDAWNEAAYRYTGSNGNISQIIIKPNAGEKCAPAVRVGSSNYGYSAHFSNLSGGNYTYISLYKNGSGGWQTWGSGTWSASADHTVRIVASGTTSPVTVSVYVDSVLLIDAWSDSSSPYTTGLSGVHLIGDGSNDYAFGDDWTDGDTGGGTSAVPVIMRSYRARRN